MNNKSAVKRRQRLIVSVNASHLHKPVRRPVHVGVHERVDRKEISQRSLRKMNYLILYLTSCVAIDRDSCCNTDGITNFHEPDLETLGCVTQCMIKLGFQILTEDDMILSQTQCATDCIGKKKGYITEDGRFLVRAFWNMTDERLKGRKYDKAITKCFREYERASTSDGPYNDLELKVLYCIYKDVQLRCPIIKQDHPKKCMALQKYLRNDDREIPRQPCDEKMANKFVSFFETMVKGVESAAS